MKKIALFLAEGFEEIEALTVVDLARRARLEIQTVSISEEKEVPGSHGILVTADEVIGNIDFEELDMIVLPGGLPGTDNLENCTLLQEKIRYFLQTGRQVAAICAAPRIFGHLGVLEGKQAVCYPTMEGELKGAQIPDTTTAVSGNLITARGMGCAIDFGLKIVEHYAGKDKARELEEQIVYGIYRRED